MTTSTDRPATASGTFTLGDRTVHRLGYGAMRITGQGIWGPPADRDAAVAVLRRAVDLGVDLVDTADSYGPFVSEDLIREALHPYDGVLIATKGGLTRSGPDEWAPVGRPEYLRQCVEMSLRRLGVERIDLWQLHRIDPAVPVADQFGATEGDAGRGQDRHAGSVRGRRRGDRAGPRGHRRGDRAEPLQRRRPGARGRARALRRARASVLSRGSRSRPASWPAPAARSTSRPRSTAPPSRSSPSRGCCAARRWCCRSRGPARSSTWTRTSRRR